MIRTILSITLISSMCACSSIPISSPEQETPCKITNQYSYGKLIKVGDTVKIIQTSEPQISCDIIEPQKDRMSFWGISYISTMRTEK